MTRVYETGAKPTIQAYLMDMDGVRRTRSWPDPVALANARDRRLS